MTKAERELLLATKAWAKDKGILWNSDVRLLNAIAAVLGVEIEYGGERP